MADRCIACGKPITTVRAPHPRVTLTRIWVHVSWWANRSHNAIPEEMVHRAD